jgi:apolipoprotein N-acyltransferase
VIAIASLGLVVGYGSWRLGEVRRAWESLDRSTDPLALIIQGNIDTQFPQSAREMQDYFLRIQEDYRRLSQEGRERYPTANLVIWPEGAWQQSVVANRLEDLATGRWENQEAINRFWEYNLRLPGEPPSTPLPEMIVGSGTYVLRPIGDEPTDRDFLPLHSFNSAIHWPAAVKYDKNFRVLFGEYLPLADQFPVLNRLTPFSQNLSRGLTTRTFQIGQTRLLPSICFESTVPQLVRQHRRAVTAADGSPPDWLVNLTNDGWFFGTTCLDFHLACNVFRAVEHRRPCVVAANTGFSAEISPAGELLQQGPRRQEAVLPVRLSPAPQLPSCYAAWGEWPGLAIAVLFLLVTRRRLP